VADKYGESTLERKRQYDLLHQSKGWASMGYLALWLSQNIGKDKCNVLSPSSCNGGYERVFRQIFEEFTPGKFSLVAGDLVDYKKYHERIYYSPFYIGAAERLPFKNNSFDVIIDLKGALWYKLSIFDIKKSPTQEDFEQLSSLLEEYNRVLTKEGMLITDAYPLPEFASAKETTLIPSTTELYRRFQDRYPKAAIQLPLLAINAPTYGAELFAPFPYQDIDLSKFTVFRKKVQSVLD
jgi:hypothetical protein